MEWQALCPRHRPPDLVCPREATGEAADPAPERRDTATECDAVALQLNTRPRKTLQWQTPGQALNNRLVATTG